MARKAKPEVVTITERPLGPDKLIRRAELPVYCGLRRSQIDNLIAHKEFPAPIHLSEGGRAIAWLASEILSWQLRRIAARERGGAS
jgi:predicted DNA-binding transcriptional regulator AlpA